MWAIVRATLTLSALLVTSSFAATPYQFTTFDVPGASRTSLISVNNLGHILGEYTDGTGRHFFRFDGSEIVAFDFPQSGSSFLGDFNDRGEIVGLEWVESVDPPGIVNKARGFMYDGVSYRTIEFPGAVSTSASGNNNRGQIVGSFGSGLLAPGNGYIVDGASFNSISFPGATHTTVDAINDAGQIAGTFSTTGAVLGGNVFVFDGTTYTEVAAVHDQVSVGDMNSSGAIVGSHATCTLCTVEGAPFYYGFVIENGEFTRIAFPGADDTFVAGINDAGTLVGEYYDPQGAHGFIATPVPEPATAVLAVLAVVVATMAIRIARAFMSGRRRYTSSFLTER